MRGFQVSPVSGIQAIRSPIFTITARLGGRVVALLVFETLDLILVLKDKLKKKLFS